MPREKNVGFIDLDSLDISILSFGEADGEGENAQSNGAAMKLDFTLDGSHGVLGHSTPVTSRFLTIEPGRGNVDTSVYVEDLTFNAEQENFGSTFKGEFSANIPGKDCVSPEVVKRLKRPGKIIKVNLR